MKGLISPPKARAKDVESDHFDMVFIFYEVWFTIKQNYNKSRTFLEI